MQVHLVDGTYELFRHHFALPSRVNADGLEIAATRGVLTSMLTMLEEGATHIAVATDRTVESFRNALWDGYKTGEELDPELGDQFPVLDEVLAAVGFTVLSMIDHEADDGLASAATLAAADPEVERVLICTPDKDLAQCVVADRVVQFDRRKGEIYDHDGVIGRFGVAPASIPDYLALMGDTADGFPGLPGWGAKSSSTVLARYGHLEDIPVDAADWDVTVRGAAKLAATLDAQRDLALLFRRIATVVTDAPTVDSVAQMRWTGPTADLADALARVDAVRLTERIERLTASRA
ncbi:MAG: flap endonuclease [Acidimicrobiia bacterium]|nr:flap endonuclease [Acidimicrobiia bacterium]